MTDFRNAPGARIDRIEGKNAGNPERAKKTLLIGAALALVLFAAVKASGHSNNSQGRASTCATQLERGA